MRYFILSLIFFVLGAGAGWSFFYLKNSDSEHNITETRQGGYEFINPLLDCDQGTAINKNILKPFRNIVADKIEQLKESGQAAYMSVYYRDLNNGPWFGVDEDANFSPQSLLKVPMMIAYLKMSENDLSLLDTIITYDPATHGISEEQGADTTIVEGKSYSIWDLIEKMIIDSDNVAFNILTLNINQDTIRKIHTDLGITFPDISTPDDFVSVKAYASLFRVLYNSSYISRPSSEKALELLSRTSYINGIVAGLPESTVVSHKYGIRKIADGGSNQLHDCGIIYNKDKPFILCVMTRGDDIGDLENSIRDVSQLVYQEVNK